MILSSFKRVGRLAEDMVKGREIDLDNGAKGRLEQAYDKLAHNLARVPQGGKHKIRGMEALIYDHVNDTGWNRKALSDSTGALMLSGATGIIGIKAIQTGSAVLTGGTSSY